MAVAGKFSWILVVPYSVAQIAGGIVGATFGLVKIITLTLRNKRFQLKF